MSSLTARAGLVKPVDTELQDVAILDANMDKIDSLLGFGTCTSGTRPVAPFTGQTILESDTGILYVYIGTRWQSLKQAKAVSGASNVASASTTWVRIGPAPAVIADGVTTFKITVSLSAAYSTVSGDVALLGIMRPDGSALTMTRSVYLTASWGNGTTLVAIDVPPAGSIVYEGGWQRAAGSGVCTEQGNQIIVEQI